MERLARRFAGNYLGCRDIPSCGYAVESARITDFLPGDIPPNQVKIVIEPPKLHWSTKLILGLLFLLAVLLGVLWFSRENQISWINEFIRSSLVSETPTPTTAAEPTPTAPVFPDGTPLVTATGITPIFSGPGEDFDEVALLTPGQQAMVEGISEDEAWWAINVPYLASGRGWVARELVQAENTLGVQVVSVSGQPGDEGGSTTGRALANVNIRSGPGLNFQKVGSLEINQETSIVGIDPEGFWYFVDVPGVRQEQGWVSVDYVAAQNTDDLPVVRYQPANANRDVPTPAPDKPALTAIAVVNIRSGPDTIFQVLGKLEAGQRAEIVGVSADERWYAIKYTPADTGRAWVAADFVEVENAEDLPVLP